MSAQGWLGKDLVIALDGEPIAAVRAKSVSYAATPIDITDGESNGFRRILEVADSFTVDVDVDGVCTVDNYALLLEQWYGEVFSDVEVRHPDGSVEIPEDGAFLSALSRSGEHGGMVSFQARFAFSGAITSNTVAPVLNAAQYGENIRLVWSAATVPDTPVDFYVIFRRIDDDPFEYLDGVSGDVLTYLDEDSFNEGEVVEYYVVAYGQATSELESNRDAVTYEPFGGIFAGRYDSMGYPWIIGRHVSNVLLEALNLGSTHGDPLPGTTILVAADGYISPVQNGVFGVEGFLLLLQGDSSTPAADAFTSLVVNGVTYLSADCDPVADYNDMQWHGAAGERPTPPHNAETSGTNTPGANVRAWFWPVQAGLVDGEPYSLTFS